MTKAKSKAKSPTNDPDKRPTVPPKPPENKTPAPTVAPKDETPAPAPPTKKETELQGMSDIDDQELQHDNDEDSPFVCIAFSVMLGNEIKLPDLFRRVMKDPDGDVDKEIIKIAKRRFEKAAKNRGMTVKQYVQSFEKFLVTLLEALKP